MLLEDSLSPSACSIESQVSCSQIIGLAESSRYQSFARTGFHKTMQGHSLEVSYKNHRGVRQCRQMIKAMAIKD